MGSRLILGVSGLGSSPGWGHCVVFLGKALTSHSIQEYKWVLANCWGNLRNCRGVTCDGLASRPGREEILLATSCDHATETGISFGSYQPVGSKASLYFH